MRFCIFCCPTCWKHFDTGIIFIARYIRNAHDYFGAPYKDKYDDNNDKSENMGFVNDAFVQQVGWKKAKMRFVYKPKVFQLSYGIQKLRGKKFFGFGHVQLGGIGPKIWDFGIFSDFCTFFLVAKNLIYIDNAFNGYSYLKSTRKGLSDGTLMLKKEYRLARWNCD